jgi:hypothetical protein
MNKNIDFLDKLRVFIGINQLYQKSTLKIIIYCWKRKILLLYIQNFLDSIIISFSFAMNSKTVVTVVSRRMITLNCNAHLQNKTSLIFLFSPSSLQFLSISYNTPSKNWLNFTYFQCKLSGVT